LKRVYHLRPQKNELLIFNYLKFMFQITNEWLTEHRTKGGGYNAKQLNLLGIQWPPKTGWKQKLIGTNLDSEKAKQFEEIARLTKGDEASAPVPKPKPEPEPKPKPEQPKEFVPDFYVYTDGACSENGSVNAKAGMGIYFGPNDLRNLSKRVEGKQSNNTAELGAILEVCKILDKDLTNGKKVMIVSDSVYAIRACTSYGEKCASKGWAKPIPNKELVKEAFTFAKRFPNIRFQHVLGHTDGTDIHSIGNDNADRLANEAIGLTSCPYV